MKKGLALIISGVLILSLVSCKSGEKNNNNINEMSTQQQSEEEKMESIIDVEQKELNEQLKKEAVKANFVELNGNDEEKNNLKVFAEGTISSVDYDCLIDIFPSFTLTQKENDGYGMYHIANLFGVEGLKDGDYVKVYGSVDGMSDTGLIKIVAIIIEKK